MLIGARNGGCTITDFKLDGSIGGRFNAATQTLAYGRPAADGHYRAYLSDPDGTNERRLTNPAWADNRSDPEPLLGLFSRKKLVLPVNNTYIVRLVDRELNGGRSRTNRDARGEQSRSG